MASITDVNTNEPVAAAQAQYGKTQNFLAGQNNQIQDFTNKFSNFVNNLPTTQSLAEQFGNQLNLPTLRNNANQIQTTLANLPYTYSQAARGTDVNANQLARIIAQKQEYLAPAATTANNALSTAENQLGQRLGYAQTDISRQLLPIQNQAQLFGQNLASGAQLFGQNEQGELSALTEKLRAGVQLTNAELDRANQLAIAKEQAASQQAIAAMQQRYQPLGYGGIYDTQTGQTLDSSRLASIGRYGTYDPITGQIIGGGYGAGTSGGGGSSLGSTANYYSNSSYPSYFTPNQ